MGEVVYADNVHIGSSFHMQVGTSVQTYACFPIWSYVQALTERNTIE